MEELLVFSVFGVSGLLTVFIVVIFVRVQAIRRTATEKTEEVEQAKKSRDETISFTTHQLRTPVTSIRGYSSFLLEGEYGRIPKKALKAVEVISRSGEHLSLLIEEYRDISRFDSGDTVVLREPISIQHFVQELYEELEPQAHQGNHSFSVRIDVNENLEVPLDRSKFKQVVHNIVENAFKYTPKGSSVVLCVRPDDEERLCFAIQDNGPGIPPEERERIFQKFERGQYGKQTGHGTGLGLYIARKIIEQHGGIIAVENGEQGGACFKITIPCKT